jgi:hypothetical protein
MNLGAGLRLVYALCLLAAACNHALVLMQHGLFWNYGNAPIGSSIFWTSLTLLDLIAAILLLVRPNAGVILTAAIILADVAHNLWFLKRFAAGGAYAALILGNPNLAGQIAFLLFVGGTMRWAWINSPPRPD